MKDHNLVEDYNYQEIIVERRPLLNSEGGPVEGLYNSWIMLNNPTQYNSYTTEAVKEIILAFRQASCDRSVVAVVFSAVGDKAFCTGGNTKEYAEYYAGNPQEYKQYMRLFNDMVTSILLCDKPVINRVNGMRIGGGQEIGMACDYSIAADTARFGQAGPKHGSAPDGGSTDFLHLYVGITEAIASCTVCDPWSAHQAVRIGLINKIVPVLKTVEGSYISNPFITTKESDDWGNPAFGTFLRGDEKKEAAKLASSCQPDLSLLDREVELMAYSLALLMPGCLSKTLESLRKKKLEHWQQNSETNRSWLALNMMTEGRAGFKAFNEGKGKNREVDFLKLRRELAQATPWSEELRLSIMP
ncbi:MAG: 6-oxocyclohex-1-ene-1-carbonyl-CoA hydratase [Bdellovibrionales bacterium]|jgi:6-oxocyclohex-1-ene-carbonyl-CoA hydrolase|nr:6-oxocyclohex-1-ene-1-carbonyl-CoA hydratase [Bdellovibrionales bacterium]MBT3526191.1 6-oxocyclohex-1-ene-1-carbonyl-CoA hydratase [Bdellovibrionales bacterium]MBT7767966.1 6-oxocyclohex-1-ene-1-carbonyl-CoA hydratase [Bdellovibrionales bacterium]